MQVSVLIHRFQTLHGTLAGWMQKRQKRLLWAPRQEGMEKRKQGSFPAFKSGTASLTLGKTACKLHAAIQHC